MSYEDLEEARAKRATKEKVTTGKGERGSKCKSRTPEAEAGARAQAGSLKVVTDPPVPKNDVVGTGEVDPARTLEAPYRTPVARMY